MTDYNIISNGKHCSEHGGLIIYVHDDFDYELFSVLEDSIGWKNLFIKIHDQKKHEKIVVGNIYCVLNELSDNLQVFNEEFPETLEILQTMQSLVVTSILIF